MAESELLATQILLTVSSTLNKYPAKQHAQNVAQGLGVKHGLLYLPGQPRVFREDSDVELPFRQRRYFYYLSGVQEPDCHIMYDIGQDVLTLFIPPSNMGRIIYNGRGLTVAEAYDKYDVDIVKLSSDVSDLVTKWARKNNGHIFILHPTQEAFPGQNKLPRVDYTKLQMAINQCRVIKDEHEIQLIRKANEISADAHRTILANIRGLENEAQVEGIFKDMCISKGAKHQAYPPIAGSGANAAILHYVKNDEPLEGRQLMVLDAGAEWGLYASDVTRTFPLRGEWSKEAESIYDLVQSMQDACIERIKPGIRFLDLHALAHDLAVRGLLELGILHNGEAKEILEAGTSLAFFPHGLGHHLGLEVHDVSDTPINSAWTYKDPDCEKVRRGLISPMCQVPVDAKSAGLEEGMVVTVEPGIYFSRFAVQHYLKSPEHCKYINKDIVERYYPVGGVRIEDNILVTASGYENLTTAPKGDEMMRTIRGPSPKSEPPKFDGGLLWTQQQRASGDELMEKAIVACAYCRKRQIRCVRLSGNSDCQTCTRFDLQCDSSSRLQKAIEEASNEKLYYAFPQLLNHGKPEIRKTMVDFFNDKVPLQHATGLGSARSDLMSGTVSTTGSRPETLISDYTTSNPAPVRWTEEEDKFLLHARKSGLDWNQIQHLRFPHKTDNACRKRHERLPARRNAEEQDCPHHSLSKEESSESMPPLRLQHESVAPQVPKKIPELPQKPLAYRHSLPALSDVAALQPQQKLFTHLKPFQEQQYPQHQHGEEFNETAKSSTSEMRRLHYFENVPSSTAATGLRRAQTMRTPSRARPLESFGPRSPRDSQSFEITIRIAAVAATYVNSIPQNRDKDINGDEIRRVLEANPTLSDLCRMLRAMGVTVNEGTFADTLVRSVPDVNLLGLAKPVSLSQTRSQFKPARYRIRRPHTYIEPSTSTANWPSLPRPISDSADGGPETGSRLSYAGLSGTHEWVEQRLSKLMSDEFLRR